MSWKSILHSSRTAAPVAILAALSGCAALTQGPGGRPDGRAGATDVLTGAEIIERAPSTPSVLQAIRRFKGTWLRRTQSTTSFQNATSPIRVYVDGVGVGNVSAVPVEFADDSPNLQYLDSYSIQQTFEVRYFNARDATQRWGTGHTGGAIEIISGTPGVAPRNQPPEINTTTDAEEAEFRFGSFSPQMTWFLHSGTAEITQPFEVSQVWERDVNYGGGIGIQPRRNITLFASVEYNRFAFSPNGTISYFMNRTQGQLRSSDGVEVIGDPSTIFNASANVKAHPETGIIRPYLFGGVGYARFTAGAFTLSGQGGQPLPRSQFGLQIANGGNQVENSFSVAGGGGFDVGDISGWRLFADIRYITAIRGPRYEDAYQRFQLFNTRYYPVRVGISYR